MLKRSLLIAVRTFCNNSKNNYISPSCYEIQDVKYDMIISDLDKIKKIQIINYSLLLINTLISAIF
jgi:hypothetical protein